MIPREYKILIEFKLLFDIITVNLFSIYLIKLMHEKHLLTIIIFCIIMIINFLFIIYLK